MTIISLFWGLSLFPTVILSLLLPPLVYFAMWLLVTGIVGSFRMLRSLNWPSTSGKLVRMELKYRAFRPHDSSGKQRQITKVKTYIYSVHGEFYMSSQTLASDSLFANLYKPLTKSYPSNKTDKDNWEDMESLPITVYYNPKNPKKACLEQRFDLTIFYQLFAGLVFGGMVIYLAIVFLSKIITHSPVTP